LNNYVVAPGLDGQALEAPIKAAGQFLQLGGEVVPDCGFVGLDRFDVDQTAR
jgi:hypothetical protein